MPLSWDATEAYLVGRQGTTHLWGTCGECVVANSLNLVLGTAYTEADLVGYVLDHGYCVSDTGGMTVEDIVNTYCGFLPLDTMDVHAYCDVYAPDIETMAARLDAGTLLNVSIYGEMMREGGHGGEGEVYGTHWVVLHEAVRNDDGSVAGFRIIDSASDVTYVTAQELSDYYYGRDGTTIVDPACVYLFGWRYADGEAS